MQNNQTLNIPVFAIAETCENSSNKLIKDLNKKRNILSIFRRKRKHTPLENLTPLDIFQVDRKIMIEKANEQKQMLKPQFSPEFINWSENVRNYADKLNQLRYGTY